MKAFFWNWNHLITGRAARDCCGAIKDNVIARSGPCDLCPEQIEGEAISSRVYWRLLQRKQREHEDAAGAPLRNNKYNEGDH
jgi:hypothetical protein